MAEQNNTYSGRQFSNPLFREIHKNTWLKKVHQDPKKKKERVWVVFCIHDDTEAFLEIYSDDKAAILHKPDRYVFLNNTLHISRTICAQDKEYEFVITLETEVIRLAAPSREAMLDWVDSLRGKLQELHILTPKENVYIKLPENKKTNLLPTRDPTSPLPPPPTTSVTINSSVNSTNGTTVRNISDMRRQVSLSRSHSASSGSSSLTINQNRSNDNITIVEVNPQPSIFNFNNISFISTNDSPTVEEPSSYERLFQLEDLPGPSRTSSSTTSASQRVLFPQEPCLTLREQQVLQLQKEMKHPGGVRLWLRKKDCLNSIAFVDANNRVWVCGWKQKDNPLLYNVLHIGDEVLSIQGVIMRNTNDIQRILREAGGIHVTVVIKRIPYGRVFVIRRETEGQALGIVQEGNTAIISNVLPDSLAFRHGLTERAYTCDGLSLTNWVLTEINGRPLNLFFKENQIKDRLNSVGRDISILVQPLDLIKQLKKQLKSLRNYKDYILQ